jgi:membrane protein insertase Oxa1/YidC/SpoIIIJ
MSQSMGTIMPIMYGFFSLQFSIGLSIYFLVSNLIGIAQSWLMQRAQANQAVPATITPPAPARRKADGTPSQPKQKTAKTK